MDELTGGVGFSDSDRHPLWEKDGEQEGDSENSMEASVEAVEGR